MNRALIVLLLLLAAGCYHPQEIVGEGDIISSNGEHDCLLEQAPCTNLVEGDYMLTYTAVPRPGWRFSHWENCGEKYPQCTYNITAAQVTQFAGLTVPPLRAVFEPLAGVSPNVLVIIADDLGYNDLAINNGNAEIHTPNMDQLANDGVLFKRHYAATVCSPARASLLTGLWPERLGYLPNGPGISNDIETMPEKLQQLGYTTWHIGKWHIGDIYRNAWPDYQGFDHWLGFLNQWRLAGEQVSGEIVPAQPRYEDPWLEGSAEPGRHFTGHLEDILTEESLDVLEDLQGQTAPWFLNLAYYAPHSPISPSQAFAQLYPDTKDGRYRALVHQLDHNIGRIVDLLELTGAIENTIVVVVSDNGGWANQLDNNDNNFPFLGFKTSLQEGGLRTPLIIRWPDGLAGGSVVDDVVSIEDIYPTILEALGEAIPSEVDGHSFYQSMQGQQLPVVRDLFWEHYAVNNAHAVLASEGQWRMLKPPPLWGIELGPFLYDLVIDPLGHFVVTPPPQPVIDDLSARYLTWFKDVHQVQATFVPDGNGGGTVQGRDLLRTPGLGAYTFGIAIGDGHEGNIATQAGIWQLSQSGSDITAVFGGMTLTGVLNNPAACNSIVLSGRFDRVVSTNSNDYYELTLYINGVEVDSASLNAAFPVSDTAIPTVIGDAAFPANDPLSAPVILNRSLATDSAWSLPDFSGALCP